MNNESPVFISGMAPTKIIQRGRPKGNGKNIKALAKLKAGDVHSCIFGVDERRMNSIRASASQQKIPILVRKGEDGTYAIWRKEV